KINHPRKFVLHLCGNMCIVSIRDTAFIHCTQEAKDGIRRSSLLLSTVEKVLPPILIVPVLPQHIHTGEVFCEGIEHEPYLVFAYPYDLDELQPLFKILEQRCRVWLSLEGLHYLGLSCKCLERLGHFRALRNRWTVGLP